MLNYHQINDTEKNALTVNTEQFEAQMKYLSENGYTAITPADMLDAWENGTKLPEKPVVITFDDGYLDTERLQRGLIVFESPTLSHEELTKAPDLDEAKHQLTGSKQAIEWNLGKQVNFIAYPCGEYNDDIEQATKDAGYRAAFTVNYGLAEPGEDPFILDRVPIFGSNSHTLLRFKLRLTLAPLFAPLNKIKMDLRKDHPALASFIFVP